MNRNLKSLVRVCLHLLSLVVLCLNAYLYGATRDSYHLFISIVMVFALLGLFAAMQALLDIYRVEDKAGS